MRDTTSALLPSCHGNTTVEIHALRQTLNEQHDSYVSSYGPINLHEIEQPRRKSQAQATKALKALEPK
ncbi:hypothetical protein [Corynebacterium mayonis]|uniref:hypothetical protein n=1 Tax=Corynebacterium mayonis TaxID=3062461 RepID=UPI0031407DFE